MKEKCLQADLLECETPKFFVWGLVLPNSLNTPKSGLARLTLLSKSMMPPVIYILGYSLKGLGMDVPQ